MALSRTQLGDSTATCNRQGVGGMYLVLVLSHFRLHQMGTCLLKMIRSLVCIATQTIFRWLYITHILGPKLTSAPGIGQQCVCFIVVHSLLTWFNVRIMMLFCTGCCVLATSNGASIGVLVVLCQNSTCSAAVLIKDCIISLCHVK